MRCFFHPHDDAAATCTGCSRALCRACTARFTVVKCEPCLVSQNKTVARRHWTNLAITVVLYAAGVFFYRSFGSATRVGVERVAMMAIVFPSVFWGWKFLSEHTPRSMLVLPIPAWLVLLTVSSS